MKKQEELPPVEGPVMVGKKISEETEIRPMKTIVEEERIVVVQGYVFDSEVRELRSGRKILTFKITDYTSSFAVKKFSNNAKDEAMFDAVKVGQWVKVKGNVQEDSYMRDLVINAYDINEVKHEGRKDTAPEDEKRVELHLHSNMSMMDATNSISDFVAQAAKWGQKRLRLPITARCRPFRKHIRQGKKRCQDFVRR